MKTLDRFLESLRAGVALAGFLAGACGGSPSTTADAEPQTDAAGTLDLPPLASTTRVCTGPEFDGGYSGQCCEHLICRQPVDGTCPIDSDGQFYGSGKCLCGSDHPIQGPFAVNPADPDPVTAEARMAGPCCYVTTSISCVGRPLWVTDQVRVAAIVTRGDWC